MKDVFDWRPAALSVAGIGFLLVLVVWASRHFDPRVQAADSSCLIVDGHEFEGSIGSWLGDALTFTTAKGRVLVSGTFVIVPGKCEP